MPGQDSVQIAHQLRVNEPVAVADRAHVDDLAVEQLDSLVRFQDAGIGHTVVLVDRESSDRFAYRHITHGIVPSYHFRFVAGK